MNDRLDRLVSGLLRSSQSRTREWRETEKDGEYLMSFTEHSVRVREGKSRSHPGQPEIFLTILNATGDVIEEFGDEDGETPEEKVKFFKNMNDIYSMARRQAMGVDEALISILRELDDDLQP